MKPLTDPQIDPIYAYVADTIERLSNGGNLVLIADVHREVCQAFDAKPCHELYVRVGWVARDRGWRRIKTSSRRHGRGARWFYTNAPEPSSDGAGRLPPIPGR